MDLYKSEILVNTGKHIFNSIQNETVLQILNSSQEMRLEEVDPNLIDQLMEQISSNISDPLEISHILQQIISMNNINIHDIIVNSDLFPGIMDTFRNNPIPSLIESICNFVYFSSKLTYILLKLDLITILFNCILSQDLEICHEALRFLQYIIPFGVVNRAVLYSSGLFDLIFDFLQNAENSPQFTYAVHTILVFIIFDPVYGENSYSNNGSHLPRRSDVMEQCRNLNIPPQTMLTISSFLKYGNGICQNKPLYHLVDYLLMSDDEDLCFCGISIFEILSFYSKENSIKVFQSHSFLDFARENLNCDSAKIKISIFNTICNMIQHNKDCFNEEEFKKSKKIKKVVGLKNEFIKLDPFFLALDLVIDNETPVKLKVAAASCLFYGINYIDLIQNVFTNDESIFQNLLQVHQDSEMSVRAEICCIIISIISKCDESRRPSLLSNDLILSFFDYLNDYDENKVLFILRLFLDLFRQYPDEMADIFSNDETIESFEQLSDYENPEIVDISKVLIELASLPPDGDDEDV